VPQQPLLQLEDLKVADHLLAPGFSFQLSSQNEREILVCEQVLRILPGRRLVMKACAGQQGLVVVKLFFERKEYLRERRGCEWLSSAKIPTARLLSSIEDSARHCYALVFEWLDGVSLQSLCDAGDAESAQLMLSQTSEVVAAMHKEGLRQKDIHLDNFLVVNGQSFVLDAGSVDKHAKPLKASLAKENIACMLAQLPVSNDCDCDRHFAAYSDALELVGFGFPALIVEVRKRRAYRWRHYRRKLARNCTEFVQDKGWSSFVMCRRDADSAELQALLVDPDSAMANGRYLKKGNTATVALIDVAGRPLIIKRYNIKNWLHRAGRFWRASRGWSSWVSAYRLRFDALPTPCPIAIKEERWGPFRGRAYLVCEYVPGVDLLTYYNALSSTSDADVRVAELVEEEVRQLFDGLWQAGVSHGDMKATNILVREDKLQLIDLDAMTIHRTAQSLTSGLESDLKRFFRNWNASQHQRFESVLKSLVGKLASKASPF